MTVAVIPPTMNGFQNFPHSNQSVDMQYNYQQKSNGNSRRQQTQDARSRKRPQNQNIRQSPPRNNNDTRTALSQPFIPCFSMTATGTCCHGSRCKFIHDPRLLLRPATTRKQVEKIMMRWTIFHNEVLKIHNSKKNGKSSSNSDSDIFFWPAMKMNRGPTGSNNSTSSSESSIPFWSANTYLYVPGEGKSGNFDRQMAIWGSFVDCCGSSEVTDDYKSSETTANSSLSSRRNSFSSDNSESSIHTSSTSSSSRRLSVFRDFAPDDDDNDAISSDDE